MDEREQNKTELGKSKKERLIKYILITIAILIAITILMVWGYIYVKNKTFVQLEKAVAESAKSNNQNVQKPQYTEVNGITNVLLLGTDGVSPEDGTRTDSMIIATLDNNSKKVKLTSLYRDTLVDVKGYGQCKLNSAYDYGGVDLLVQTIEDTYNITLNKYISINFAGFESIINQIGGVEVDIKDYQLDELNKYIGEATGGNDCPVNKSGKQLLNGKQALSYARIRKGVGDDYERTQRQREVLFKIAEKLKTTNPIKYVGLMDNILKYIKTNIDPMEALNMAYTIYKFPNLNTEQLSIPMEGYCIDKTIEGIGDVLVMDNEANSKALNDFIFEDKTTKVNN